MTGPQASTRPVRFIHRGQIVSVPGSALARPTLSVLDWLRTGAGCTGTKEGCNEGDCGACTVVVAELGPLVPGQSARTLCWSTVNACIQFLPTLDGRALFTVEDLREGGDASPALHPVQQAMVDCHASQCGFCTPGIVMSLWHQYVLTHSAGGELPSREQLADALAGNLCRCTGYRPILDAGERMFDLPVVPVDEGSLRVALEQLEAYAGMPVDTEAWLAPRTLDQLAALRWRHPDAQWLAGSTDIGLWVNKQFRPLGTILYAGHVRELQEIHEVGEGTGRLLRIGAGATLERAWHALAQRWPDLEDVWRRFASPQVRHVGTMGGNVANGSPIGDAPPVLMALDAQVELRRGDVVRTVALTDFYLGYMKNALQPGEFLQAIRIPMGAAAGAGLHVRAYKVSKRWDCDISALCLGASLTLEGGRVRDVRLAWGGMAATASRARHVEEALRGRMWNPEALASAQAALVDDFQPMSDLRGSASYRMRTAQQLLHRLWLETQPETGPTRPVTRLRAIPVDAAASRQEG